MSYVDGFVLVIPKKNLAAYRVMARKAGKIWIEHGALSFQENIGEDMKPKYGIPYPRLIKAKPSELVAFSWITFKSRAHRDKVNAKVMADLRLTGMEGPMPFDMKRMAYGGFTSLVKL